jgi:hypothetical protein
MAPSPQIVKPALRVALLAAALVFAWQYLTVHYNYRGNWTALFCTGSAFPAPPLPEFHGTYIFQGSTGYDGQFCRYVAHDPFFSRGLTQWIDTPRLRYTRILVPLLVYATALGKPAAIDFAYYAVTMAFLFLGLYRASQYAMESGRSPYWGLAFVLVPAVLVSIDRLTIDLAAAALCCVWARSWGREKPASIAGYALLAAFPLTRETGMLLSLAAAARLARNRQFRALAVWVLTLIPCAVWYAFVALHTRSISAAWVGYWPLAGWAERVLHPVAYPPTVPVPGLITALDYAALAGILLAAIFAFQLWLRRRDGTVEIALLLFAAMVVLAGWTELWTDTFAFGRVFSPLLLLLAFKALDLRQSWLALPLALVTLRILAQFGTQILGILHGVG